MMRQRSCSFVNLHCDVIEIDKAEQINNAQVGCDGSVEYQKVANRGPFDHRG